MAAPALFFSPFLPCSFSSVFFFFLLTPSFIFNIALAPWFFFLDRFPLAFSPALSQSLSFFHTTSSRAFPT